MMFPAMQEYMKKCFSKFTIYKVFFWESNTFALFVHACHPLSWKVITYVNVQMFRTRSPEDGQSRFHLDFNQSFGEKNLILPDSADIINLLFIWSSTQAGRRGVTRNLVGHESAARVRIPAAPPKKTHPHRGWAFFNGVAGFEHSNAIARWAIACRRLDGGNTMISAWQICNASLLLRQRRPTPLGGGSSLLVMRDLKGRLSQRKCKKCPVDTF